jgi:hypothetical protein
MRVNYKRLSFEAQSHRTARFFARRVAADKCSASNRSLAMSAARNVTQATCNIFLY